MSELDPSCGHAREVLLIAGHHVDLIAGEVRASTGVVRLQPKVREVLLVLVERRGQLVSKEELLEAVWPGTNVTDDVIWRCVAALRRAFADAPREPGVIETLSRRGYRLIAEVESAPPSHATSSPIATHGREPLAAAAGLVLIAWLALTAVSAPTPQVLQTRPFAGRPIAAPASLPGSPERWDATDFTRAGREYYARRSQEDVERAIALFRAAKGIDPDHAPAWAGLADALAQKVRLFDASSDFAAQAVEVGEHAVSLDPDLAEAHKAHGYALHALGDTTGAIAAYQRAHTLDPTATAPVVNMGVLLASQGSFHEALAIYVKADIRTLASAIGLYDIGVALYQAGSLDEARRYLQAALRMDPLQGDSIACLLRSEVVAGDLAAARERAAAALEVQPGNRAVLVASAELATITGDLPRARAHLRRALEDARGERYLGAHIRLAWVERQLGDADAHAELMQTYADRFPGVVERRSEWRFAQLLAAVYLLEGDQDEAIGWLRRALDLGHLDWQWLALDPMFGPLHGDPAFEGLLKEAASTWRGRTELIAAVLKAGPLDRSE